jgi:hypothetical protein
MKFQRKIFFGIIIFLAGVINFRCAKEAKIPSYIHIDKINLTTNASLEGSNSNKIVDAWVYIDDNPVGAYEMPCTFPVLYSGTHHIKVLAGVKENGISETRIIYPFYSTYETDITLTQGQAVKINPSVGYMTGTNFQWLEAFEGSGHTLCNSAATPDTIMKITAVPSEIFEGTGSGKVTITADSYFGKSCTQFDLPNNNVFLEINYKCNTEFIAAVVGYDVAGAQTYPANPIHIRPSSDWNKIYVNLKDDINSEPSSLKFSVYFAMLYDSNVSSSNLYLDNIKLISF